MKFKALALTTVLLGLAACDQKEPAQTQVNLATDEDKFSYSLGMIIGDRVLKQYEVVDYDLIMAGAKAQHSGQDTLMTIEEADTVLKAHMEKVFAKQAEELKLRGQEYLKSNAAKEGVR